MAWFLNKYRCDDCEIGWEDEWSCCCDDECPKCGEPYSPEDSDDHTVSVGLLEVYVSPSTAEDSPATVTFRFDTPEHASWFAKQITTEHGHELLTPEVLAALKPTGLVAVEGLPLPVAGFNPADLTWENVESGHLRSKLQIGSTLFHVDAYHTWVRPDGLQTSTHDEVVGEFYQAMGAEGHLQTLKIGGADYVVFITPYGR